MKNLINKDLFYVSSIVDNTNKSNVAVYKFLAECNDDYLLSCKESISITIYDENENIINVCENEMSVHLLKNSIYYVKIETLKPNTDFYLEFYPINNKVAVPYHNNILDDGKDIPLYGNDNEDPLKPALIDTKKRGNGTYLFCNNPEVLQKETLNTVLMDQHDLKGEVFVTFEHSNRGGIEVPVYLGYKVINNDDHDIYVTVKNVGLQVKGSWLGEKSWMDYYDVHFDMDQVKKFNEEDLEWFNSYVNFDLDYKPQILRPITYKLPKGKYIYVLGGTSKDAYKNANFNNSADQGIVPGCCANGNAFFIVNEGKAYGQLCVYDDAIKVGSKDVTIQNLRQYSNDPDFGGRLGISNHAGVIDSNPIWIFNDKSKSGFMPVLFHPYYSDTIDTKARFNDKPYWVIPDSYYHDYVSDHWGTHLSPQYHHKEMYIGYDLVESDAIHDGKWVHMSHNQVNKTGRIWDYGNWMIEYQDNCVLVNQGDKDRDVKFYLENGGSIVYIIKDEDENILKTGATFTKVEGLSPIYVAHVKAHSRVFVTLLYNLPANNNGSMIHRVELV